MSAQRLSDRKVRRIERATGLKITRAWAHGGYVFDFVTDDGVLLEGETHWHGWFDTKTGEYGRILRTPPLTRVMHYSTCAELFPERVSS